MAPSLVEKMFTAEVTAKRQLTPKIYELDIKLIEPDKIDFVAGQFAMFVVGEYNRRAYSILSQPAANALTFCVDVSPGGPGSKLVEDAVPGTRFELQAPFGIFTVTDRTKDILFVATGVGIAPFKCIIEDLFATGFEKNITLLLGMRNQEEAFYVDYFEQLARTHSNFQFYLTYSQPAGEWTGLKGYVTDQLQEYGGRHKDSLLYICGGSQMIKDVRGVMAEKGLPRENVKVEVFH